MSLAMDACEPVTAPAIVWEETPCLLCGVSEPLPILEADDAYASRMRFLLVRCRTCGLCFTNPRPDPASIRAFYPADYRCHQKKNERGATWQTELVLAALPTPRQGRLLDFGCGSGGFVRRMRTLGWDAIGLDAVENAATTTFDVPVFVGTLPHPNWTSPCFDVITMWQSLEHVHQPLEVLRAARQVLVPGGKLIVTVPNFDSLASGWFGPNWYGLDVPRHLTHFTPATLERMLVATGFSSVRVDQRQHNSWIRHCAARAGGGWLETRWGSRLMGWWGRLTGRAESLLAVARALPVS